MKNVINRIVCAVGVLLLVCAIEIHHRVVLQVGKGTIPLLIFVIERNGLVCGIRIPNVEMFIYVKKQMMS